MTSSLGQERVCSIKLLEEESPEMEVSVGLIVDHDEMMGLAHGALQCFEVNKSPEESSTYSNHF